MPALRELGVGDWEGLTFQEIRRRFPETYALRGEDPVQYGIPVKYVSAFPTATNCTVMYGIIKSS